MEDHNNNPTTALPDDNKKPTPRSIFNDIIKAAQIYWCPLDPIPAAYRRMGHMTAWGERSLRVDLSYRPKGEQIRLQVILADQVRENSETFQDLLWRANAAYSNAKVIFDRNLRVVDRLNQETSSICFQAVEPLSLEIEAQATTKRFRIVARLEFLDFRKRELQRLRARLSDPRCLAAVEPEVVHAALKGL